MTDLTLTEKISDALIAAGLPVDWIRNVDGTAQNLQIYYLPGATEQQKAQAQALAADVIANPQNYSA